MREAIMWDDAKTEERDDFLARAVADLLPPALLAGPRGRVMRWWLDRCEAVHRDAGVEPPAWIAKARRLHMGE